MANLWTVRAEARIDAGWPGGMAAMFRDYSDGSCDLAMITRRTGVEFRALRRMFKAHGVRLRSRSEANVVSYVLNPARSQKTAEKLRTSSSAFRPEVQAKMRATKIANHRRDPSTHINAKCKPSKYEAMFIDTLKTDGVAFIFNQHAAGFWLDFYLFEMGIGIELERGSVRPDLRRHLTIIDALGLSNIIYIPTRMIRNGYTILVGHVISDLKSGSLDPSTIGQNGMVACKRKRKGVERIEMYGYDLVRPFVPVKLPDAP